MGVVVLAGTLDTKALEYEFLAEQLRAAGLEPCVVDVGVLGAPGRADISRAAVAEAAGTTLEALRALGDRSAVLQAMATGLTNVVNDLIESSSVVAVFGMGGSGAVTVVSPALRSLPLGMPKLLLTTMTATAAEALAGTDTQVIPAVVDVSGLNSYTRGLLRRMAATIAAQAVSPVPEHADRPVVAASMFGVTTAGVVAASRALEERGYEVITFHANGSGGMALESLAAQGVFQGVLDLTTTELADELLGGKASAGPTRLEAAGRAGIPQVISVGALDMANFGGPASLPESLGERLQYRHGPSDTLVRTSVEDSAALGRILAGKIAASRGPVTVLLPLGGVSSLAEDGKAFHDPAAEKALLDALVAGLPDTVAVVRVDAPLSSAEFGARAAVEMAALMEQ